MDDVQRVMIETSHTSLITEVDRLRAEIAELRAAKKDGFELVQVHDYRNSRVAEVRIRDRRSGKEYAGTLSELADLSNCTPVRSLCPHCGLFGNHLDSCEYEKFRAAFAEGGVLGAETTPKAPTQ